MGVLTRVLAFGQALAQPMQVGSRNTTRGPQRSLLGISGTLRKNQPGNIGRPEQHTETPGGCLQTLEASKFMTGIYCILPSQVSTRAVFKGNRRGAAGLCE
jgi:hypothetical protein